MARSLGTVDLPMREVIAPMTLQVRVTGLRVARVRLWLGAQVIKVGALIIGCGVEIEKGNQ